MRDLIKLIFFAFWVTLVIWFIVEKLYEEKYTTVSPTVVVTPSGE